MKRFFISELHSWETLTFLSVQWDIDNIILADLNFIFFSLFNYIFYAGKGGSFCKLMLKDIGKWNQTNNFLSACLILRVLGRWHKIRMQLSNVSKKIKKYNIHDTGAILTAFEEGLPCIRPLSPSNDACPPFTTLANYITCARIPSNCINPAQRGAITTAVWSYDWILTISRTYHSCNMAEVLCFV